MSEKLRPGGEDVDLFGDPWTEPKDPRGRKRHKRCPQIAEIVAKSRADRMSIEEIAARVGLSEPTLRQYYFRELEHGAKALRAKIVGAVFDKAMTGHPASAKLALQILEKGEAAIPVARRTRPAADEKPLGKKAAADQAAQTAHEGTEWGNLLRH